MIDVSGPDHLVWERHLGNVYGRFDPGMYGIRGVVSRFDTCIANFKLDVLIHISDSHESVVIVGIHELTRKESGKYLESMKVNARSCCVE